MQNLPTLTPSLVADVLGFIVAEAVAFGLIDAGTSQTIIAIGGVVIPAAFAIAQALHLGKVHVAQMQQASAKGQPARYTRL